MPRSYWLPIATALGLALASGVGAKPIAAHGHHDGNTSQSQQQVAEKSQAVVQPAAPVTQTDIERLASTNKSAKAKPRPTPEQQQAADNLKAQQDMATASGRMVYVAGVEAAITLLGVILVGFTLYHTREAAKAARDAVGEAKRAADATEKMMKNLEIPHVFPSEIRYFSRKPVYDTEGSGAKIAVIFKNYGRSPAIMKQAILVIMVTDPVADSPQTHHFEHVECFEMREMLGEKDISAEIETEGLQVIGKFVDKISHNSLSLHLRIIVNYSDVFTNDWQFDRWFVWNPKTNKFGPRHDYRPAIQTQ